MLTGLVGGAVLGAFVADYLSSDILQVIFPATHVSQTVLTY